MALVIWLYNIFDNKPIYFSTLITIFKDDVSRPTINKILDGLSNSGIIYGKWENFDGKLIRTLKITDRYLDLEALSKDLGMHDKDLEIHDKNILQLVRNYSALPSILYGDSYGDPSIKPNHYECHNDGCISIWEVEWEGIKPLCPYCGNKLEDKSKI